MDQLCVASSRDAYTLSETDRFRFKNVLPKAFTGDLSIELCDANHVVLVSAAEDQGFSDMSFVVANAGTPKERDHTIYSCRRRTSDSWCYAS